MTDPEFPPDDDWFESDSLDCDYYIFDVSLDPPPEPPPSEPPTSG